MAGPWEKYGGATAPAGDPVIATDPYKAEDQQFQREAAARAREAEQRAREDQALRRDKFTFDRERALKSDGGTPVMVPESAAKRTEANVGTFTSLRSAADTFQDDFGGNPIGGLENFAQSYVGSIGTPGQRQWWATFSATDNQIRNDLFGSALTAPEKAAYEATTVSPGMDPKIIRENVTQRAGIIEKALARQRTFMLANGYKPEAVDALFAPIIERQQALAATAGNASEEDPAVATGSAADSSRDAGGGGLGPPPHSHLARRSTNARPAINA